MAQGKRSWPLAALLTARFTLVAVVPVVAIGLVFLLHFAPQARRDVEERQELVANAIVAQLQAHFGLAERELSSLGRLLKAGLRAGEELNVLLDAHAQASDFYEAIYLTDRQGRVTQIGLPQDALATRNNHIGLDLSRRDFLREAQRQGKPVWSDSFLSPVSGRLAVAVAVPAGEWTLVGEVAVSPLPSLARSLTHDTALQVMMLDRQDQLVAHSGNAYANQQLNLGQLPIVRSARQRPTSEMTPFEFQGEELVGEVRQVVGPNWLVIVAQPGKVAYAPINATWLRLLVGLGLAMVAALVAAIWTARIVTQGFRHYNEQASAMANGHFDLPWLESDTVEFNQLREHLQRMAAAIQARELALQELNATLEQRVAQRTQELTRANEQLVTALQTLQRTQDELLRAEKLVALGSMVAGIAHELNTPIGNAVLAASTLQDHNGRFRDDFDGGAVRRSSLQNYLDDSHTACAILLRNLQRANDLIRSFKQIAVDQTSAQRRRFRLDEVVAEILLAMQPTLKKTPYTVLQEIEDELWMDSYPGPLGQILTNLINNSVLHAFAGRDHGTIRISARSLGAQRLELLVSDDGQGIAPENLGRVFDPFFTTRLGTGGSGMGLNIVHTLATRVLGGQIEVSSSPGHGCRFRLELPHCAPQGPNEGATPALP